MRKGTYEREKKKLRRAKGAAERSTSDMEAEVVRLKRRIDEIEVKEMGRCLQHKRARQNRERKRRMKLEIRNRRGRGRE